MDSPDNRSGENPDFTPAVPLEISNEVAEKADSLLRGFAEDAGLETALVVDRSGALVSGISAEPEVTIDVISALVAGASGAMRALVTQLGETGRIESVHQGGDRLLYLRELVHQFILVGVAGSSLAPGIVREKANQVQPGLDELLQDIKPTAAPDPVVQPQRKSLREVARERREQRMLQSEAAPSDESVVPMPVPTVPPPIPQMDVEEAPTDQVVVEEEELAFLSEDEEDAVAAPPGPVMIPGPLPPALPDLPDTTPAVLEGADIPFEVEPEPVPEEPREVLVSLDMDEPEIVIEDEDLFESELPSHQETEGSPFELEPVFEDEDDEIEESDEEFTMVSFPGETTSSGGMSIFEIEEEEVDGESDSEIPPSLEASVFEHDDSPEADEPEDVFIEEDDELVFEIDEEDTPYDGGGGLEHLFEVEEDEEPGEETTVNLNFDDDTILVESPEEEEEVPVAEDDSDDEEAELKGSGPMYF